MISKIFKKNKEYKDLIKQIKNAEYILIFTHVNPDGDALGSFIAITKAIKRIDNKSVFPILLDTVHHDLDFLPYIDNTIQLKDFNTDNIDFSKALAISVDVAGIDRLSDAKPLFMQCAVKAQFDHHETNNGFADINIIDATSSSTASMIYYFYKKNNLKIDSDIATVLYTGISTDTGNFSFNNTDYRDFEIMADLMKIGLQLSDTNYILFHRRQIQQQKILGRALNNLNLFAEQKAAYFYLNKNDFIECDAYSEHITNFANQLIDIEGVLVAFFIYENRNGAVRVSFRSKNGYRVDEIASKYGGGGHKYASGCNMNSSLDSSIKLLKEDIEKLF